MRISKEQKLKTAEIAKKHKLKLVIIFGSFASGKNRKDSDLDIGVISEKEISFEKQIKLTNEFSVIFRKNIDLSILNHTNPLLLFEASRSAILLYGKQKDFFEFRLRAFHAYNDYQPFFKLENELNKKIIKSYAN